MRRALSRYKDSRLKKFVDAHKKYLPVIFFIGGFIFDTLTLNRIDRLYDLIVLCIHMTLLTLTIIIYNLADDGKWRNTWIHNYEIYLPLAIQFFFGGLSSAYVIYFSRSVSLSKTFSFFIILVGLLLANELLKKRISNKYLQFSIYFFVSFVFFTFMIPVFIKKMNTDIFIISGSVSLLATLVLVVTIYIISPSTRSEVGILKLTGIIVSIYAIINLFYFLRLIPPVPLALSQGMVAHDISIEDNKYIVSYETDDSFIFWRKHRLNFIHKPEENVYVFSAIFAPTDLEKSIFHRWKYLDKLKNEWEIVEDIGFDITGGRDEGYRGFTYKNNVREGTWKVEVITEEELVLGVIDFEIIINPSMSPIGLIKEEF